MSLLFPYKILRAKAPVHSLGGRWSRPEPLIWVTVIGPGGARVVRGLLDTGSDDMVFPESLATQIGIDLSNAASGSATGVGGNPIPLRYAEVSFRLAGSNEQREWRAMVGFTPVSLRRPLLGFAGFLQFFTATFRGDIEQVELMVNQLYPGI